MGKARIMVVEDEGIVAADIKMSLEHLGYDVTSMAASGEEAVEKAEKERPDLVLMDIMLSGKMDGIEATGRIRTLVDIPVVYVTAYADEKMLDKAKITEPFGYIVKPIEDRDLNIAIEMALYKHKMDMDRSRLVRELREALANVRTLRGLLPICAWCKKIRDDKGYWDAVEIYIEKRSDAKFTHGICPECREKVEEKKGDEGN